MKLSWKKAVLFGLLFVPLAIIGNIVWTYFAFSPAESTLKSELAQFSLPADYNAISSTYSHGYCFDNCPDLRAEYAVNTTREATGQAVKSILVKQGYTITDYSAGNVWASKDKIRVNTHSEPRLDHGTRDYASNLEQQMQQITSLTISFTYHP